VKVGIIDYGGGNLRSVANALRSLGQDPEIIANPDQVGDCTHLLLPGQGAFGDTMERLEQRGLATFLKDWIAADRPYFGICVGYQILFDSSEEAPGTVGLGIVPGTVRRFQDEPGLKIPHMGWNSATATRGETRVWQGFGAAPYFYYIHSYHPQPAEPSSVVAVTTHGTQTFAGAVERGNLFACQFHPEKSQEAGLRLIRNFLGLESEPPS
jgi:imidazole glycerol phosphate synthase glutamine amidotransferase subunit